MITRDQFMRLRSGDVLIIKTKRGSYRRTVITGPADWEPARPYLVLPIRRKSWTGRCRTTQDWNSIGHRIAGVAKTRARLLINKDEIFSLLNWCDKPSRLIERELKERHRCGALNNRCIARKVMAVHRELKGVGL